MNDKLRWLILAPYLDTEYSQCLDEGKRVEGFWKELKNKENMTEEEAEKLAEKMNSCEVGVDYKYYEPSEYNEIVKNCTGCDAVSFTGSDSLLEDKIRGAWLGRICGCLLGKPVEGYKRQRLTGMLEETGNFPLSRYIEKKDFDNEIIKKFDINTAYAWADNLNGAAPCDDDTNYTVLAMKVIERYGVDFLPDDILESWMR